MTRSLSLLLFCSLLSASAFCQDTIRLKTDKHRTKIIITDRPPQAVYFGIGGAGLIFSFNYDRRFQKRLNGFGFGAGFGFFGAEGTSIFSLPLSLNYLAGRKNHFAEFAAGVTYASASTYSVFEDYADRENEHLFIGHINLGYRYHPAKGGFFGRIGSCPLFAKGESITFYYLGVGYAF